ncbi:MAG: SPOR domain-containing protein [Rickettsiales bacterium]|nr:SPOR domain-containing protein [Rickettsiales bacterium]
MNMNNDDFFNDIQDDIQNSDMNNRQMYQPIDTNKKNKMLLTVVISFVVGLLILAMFLIFVSGKEDDDMVSIGSYEERPVFPDDKALKDVNSVIGDVPANIQTPVQQPVPVAVKPAPVVKVPVAVKPAPVAPVVKPAPVVVAPKVEAVKGPWKVQLMSAQDKENKPEDVKVRMEAAWNKLVAENSVLKDKSFEIEKTVIKGADWYRLRVVGLMTTVDATKLCETLKTNKVDCIPVK